MKKAAKSNVPVLGEAVKALDNIVDAWKQYMITAEVEQTKRESIRAMRDTNIQMIEANSAVLKAYLEKTFAERALVIEGMFERLDQGFASGNNEIAASAMAAIVAVTKQSPLAGAREILIGLNDPNVKSIEI